MEVQNSRMVQDSFNVGQVAFKQSWDSTECQGVITRVADGEFFLQLHVAVDGQRVWSSPQAELNDEDWAFGSWCDGSGLPQMFADIDGDGRPELLAPVPKADLAPTVFRVFRWNGQELNLVRKSSLLKNDRDVFAWAEAEPGESSQMLWIDNFVDGVAQIVHRRRATTSLSASTLQPTAEGFSEPA